MRYDPMGAFVTLGNEPILDPPESEKDFGGMIALQTLAWARYTLRQSPRGWLGLSHLSFLRSDRDTRISR